MKKDIDYKKELKEIREALVVAEGLRFQKGLSETDRADLEKASVALRKKERALIEKIGSDVADQIKTSSANLQELAKRVRARTTKLSKTAKWAETLNKLIRTLSS
ncbi:MAG: hypothetical protein CVU13_09950 [Bacteroidetes bacterium HGW-Bacteroidetes-8]|jgi:hypothetical protein|nr:MAG: hypothetical protein CVU13_09950 [Bacteroidetes bacterium HGW-Bacteroidetes-8]